MKKPDGISISMTERQGLYMVSADSGIVSFPNGQEVEVNFFVPKASNKDVLRNRGLTDEQMAQGIASVKKGNSEKGTFKHVVFDPAIHLKVIDVERGFGESIAEPWLTGQEITAMQAVSDAIGKEAGNEIPNKEVMETAQKFSRALRVFKH